MTSEAMEEIAYLRQGLEKIKQMVLPKQYKEYEAYVDKRTKELGGDSIDQNRAK